MTNLLQRSCIILVCCLILACILAGMLFPASVRADVGVHPLLPGGSGIKPGETTPIQMASETVVMTIRAATIDDNAVIELNPGAYGYQPQATWFSAVAEVHAEFTMKNPTSEAVNMTVWFPLASVLKTRGWDEISPEEIVPRIQGFSVLVNSHPLDYAVSDLPNPNGVDKPMLPWASFPVTFPAGKDTVIHVSYVLPLSPLPKSNALALYYIFQTGAGWAGPIGRAELILNLPYPASTETLSGMPAGSLNPPYFFYSGKEVAELPSGAILEGNQARWIWESFEPGPEDDFSILLIAVDKTEKAMMTLTPTLTAVLPPTLTSTMAPSATSTSKPSETPPPSSTPWPTPTSAGSASSVRETPVLVWSGILLLVIAGFLVMRRMR